MNILLVGEYNLISLIVFPVLIVNEFSLFKDAPTSFGKRYTIQYKTYMIHTLELSEFLYEVASSENFLATVGCDPTKISERIG